MKKIIIAMVVILVMSLTVMAQGEVRVVSFETIGHQELQDDKKVDVVDHCYVIMFTDYGEESIKVEVSEEEYKKLYTAWHNEFEAEKEEHENRWYVKTLKWCGDAAENVKDFVVFWD